MLLSKRCLLKEGKKLYACFVDFGAAFDFVQRKPLFKILNTMGISGKFMQAIISMYTSVSSCVRLENRLTELFDCPAGLRQGCSLSPILFSIFINEVAANVDEYGIHGIQLLPGLIQLFILLFADDIALLSDTTSPSNAD